MNTFNAPFLVAVEESALINSGLVMNFDASNRKSYNGLGTVWKNMVFGATDASLGNLPVYTRTDSGGYITFNGSNQYASIPYQDSYDPTVSITFEAVVYGNGVGATTYQEIYRKENANRHLFSFQNNAKILSFGITTSVTGYQELDAVTTAASYNNQWTHLVATYISGKKVVYRNGVSIGSTTGQTGTISQANAVAYLASFNASSENLKASIAFFRMYNRNLSASEVLQNFNALKSKYSMS